MAIPRGWLFALAMSVLVARALVAGETIELFDGRSLEGWEYDARHWRVEGNAIVGEIPRGETLRRNTWLIWRGREVEDFDLRVQVKLSGAPAANSGIQFRCQVDGVEHVSGYQADLDQGAVWLGRIYDEHGRALLVERGTRVLIERDGTRRTEVFAPANQYAVLFREGAWNDYRIVAIGDHIAVYVNGTLFSELKDQQTGQRDLRGWLAFQLHSGPETRVEYRQLRCELLAPHDTRLGPFSLEPTPPEPPGTAGVFPRGANGAELNLGFESGTLDDWSATGDAFARQPVNRDGISQRWPDQASGKQGDYFVGGFEIVRDQGLGRLVSSPFRVTHPYASFLIGGGNTRATRVEVFRPAADGAEEKVLFEAMGQNREAMRRVVADLRSQIGQTIAVRLIDDSRGGWGHLNFDDFRFHDEPPAVVEHYAAWRSTRNPVLAHLVPNPSTASAELPGGETTAQMMVPRGFSVDVIAAEPELHQPMAFTFDARGRLWVAEGHCYPQKRPDGQGLDCILIFTDHDGNGSFEHRQVFAEGLNLVSGLEVGMGGVWVGAAPELLFIPDRDGDDRPDSAPEVRLDGFGFADTHETLNSFLWGPDGWLYGNQGVFNRSLVGKPGAPDTERQAMQAGVWRYHPIRRVFEVFAQGGSNQWGLDYDEHGQLFMTHCRSRWGEGLTTHVMQGGHYWNQVNSGYAPFISATPLRDQPALRNYLLASARYGHGEGGAGKPGSGQVYGGHSHVGTLIYLGDNWPAELRNHLFTHNLHGHQLNHQINLREAGGYNTVHAGYDLLFCADPQYIGVDLQTGPDGAVYISDWYDPRHCHNPNVEHWDRGNGRIYRMKFDATYTPARADYVRATDEQLVAAQLHRNDWHVRAARLELSYRASTRPIATVAVQRLRELAMQHSDADRRLRALWALHGIGAVDPPLVEKLLADGSEYVRGWTVQLAIESLEIDAIRDQLLTLASSDDSLLVRRYLASALPRVPSALGWQLAATLVAQPENAADRDLPLLLWYGVASLMQDDVPRAMKLGDTQCLPVIRDYLDWYAAKISAQGRADLTDRLAVAEGSELRRLLSLFELAVRGMRNLEPPPAWSTAAERLYELPAPDLRRASATIGAAFSDERLFQRQRALVADSAAPLPDRQFALSLLAYDPSSQNLPIYLQLLDSPLAPSVVPLLSQYADTSIAPSLIDRLASGGSKLREPVLETLSSRPAWASQLLDAINRGQVDKRLLNAYYARQMSSLGDAALNERLSRQWGMFAQTPAELRDEIETTVAAFQSAPLWAYSAQDGAALFKSLCATCHQLDQQVESIAPRLAGSGAKGIRYLVENVVDPNAVIGRDYQARILVTRDGRVTTGLIEKETDSAVTVRTATNSVTLAKSEIEELRIAPQSFMPVGLLKDLNERQRLELFKFLSSL